LFGHHFFPNGEREKERERERERERIAILILCTLIRFYGQLELNIADCAWVLQFLSA